MLTSIGEDAIKISASKSSCKLSLIRDEIPYVLEACRDPSEWFDTTGVSCFVYQAMQFIETFIDELELNEVEGCHLDCIGMLALIVDESDLAFEVICRIEEMCGGRALLGYLSNEVLENRPGIYSVTCLLLRMPLLAAAILLLCSITTTITTTTSNFNCRSHKSNLSLTYHFANLTHTNCITTPVPFWFRLFHHQVAVIWCIKWQI